MLSNPQVKSMIINVFGGGIMRCDTIADAILLVNQASHINVPLVVRLEGTNSKLAVRRLRESLPRIVLAKNMAEAAEKVVSLANRPAAEATDSTDESRWPGRIKKLFSGADVDSSKGGSD